MNLNLFLKKKPMKNLAFTLAEVLIVLGIIGIVAEMTIPSLLKNYEKEVTVTRLEKAYSEIYQAIKTAEVDNGTMANWNFADSNDLANNYIYPYLKASKKCDGTTDTSCWATPVCLNNVTSLLATSSSGPSMISPSGYSILFNNAGFDIWIDVDGPYKGKNMIGRDVFWFGLTTSGLSPAGINAGTRTYLMASTTGNACNKVDTSRNRPGGNCAAVIMMDGWKIADDYPW